MAKPITATQVMELIKRQNFKCALSGRELTPQTASLDHIFPLSRGGEHCIANVWVVDYLANTAKATMTVDEFVQLCREVTEHQSRKCMDSASCNGSSEKFSLA